MRGGIRELKDICVAKAKAKCNHESTQERLSGLLAPEKMQILYWISDMDCGIFRRMTR